jgi:serine protease Do
MKRIFFFAVITSVLTSVISVVGINYFVNTVTSSKPKDGSLFSVTNAIRPTLSAMPDFSDVAESVTSSVVNIKATTGSSDLLDNLWGSGTAAIATGSGVVISAEGYIVTNQHVIERSSQVEITLGDKRIFNAKVVGEDEASDIALLKINATDPLPHIELGNSDELRVGQWVLAVGNPFNLSSTVTAGIVSAKGRNIDIMEGEMSAESFIQTDAAVNPGNSGGALISTRGQLIGINTAIMTRTGSYEGYSFAIPSNIVKKVVKDLKEFGMVQRAFIGIVPSEVSPILAQKLGLKTNGGVHISKIQNGGAAEDAGLKEGDVILSLDNVTVKTMIEYQQQLATYRPGASIQISYWRNNKIDKVSLKLRNQSNTAGVIDKQALDMLNQLGLQTRDMTSTERTNLQTPGVMVINIRPGSKIALTNMEQDFVITKINGKTIKNQAAFVSALNSLSNKILLEGFYPSVKGMYAYTFIK